MSTESTLGGGDKSSCTLSKMLVLATVPVHETSLANQHFYSMLLRRREGVCKRVRSVRLWRCWKLWMVPKYIDTKVFQGIQIEEVLATIQISNTYVHTNVLNYASYTYETIH